MEGLSHRPLVVLQLVKMRLERPSPHLARKQRAVRREEVPSKERQTEVLLVVQWLARWEQEENRNSR